MKMKTLATKGAQRGNVRSLCWHTNNKIKPKESLNGTCTCNVTGQVVHIHLVTGRAATGADAGAEVAAAVAGEEVHPVDARQ